MGEQEKQAQRQIKTEGAYVEGDVHTGGDFVGRDQTNIGQQISNFFFGDVNAERARRNRENRAAMLQKVRHAWIEGVACAHKGQRTPEGYYNIERMIRSAAQRGEVAA